MVVERARGVLRDGRRLVRLSPFDTTSGAGRSDERHRRILLTTVSAAAAKAATIVGGLATVAIGVRYLGAERFGVWATLLSFVGLLQVADFGIGRGLVSRLAGATANRDVDEGRRLVSSTALLLVASASATAIIALVVSRIISWPEILRVSPGLENETSAAVAVFLIILVATIPFGLVRHVHDGLQEGYVANLWTIAAAAGALIGLVACAATDADLVWLVGVSMGATMLALAGDGFQLFWRRHPDYRPRLVYATRQTVRVLMRAGGLFFVLQAAVAIGYESDTIVIARVLGPVAVTDYAVPAALFGMLMTSAAFVTQPLWPAYSDALVRNDLHWVRITFRRSMRVTLAIIAPASLALVLIGPAFVGVWTGHEVHTSWSLFIALGIWTVMGSVGAAISMLLNAAHVVRLQVLAAITMASTNLVLSIVLAQHIGVSGVMWGTVVSYAVCVLVPYAIVVPKLLERIVPAADGTS